MAARLAAGILCARRLGDRHAPRYWFLIPPRDLWGFAVWVAGLAGTTVEWRGLRFRLSPDGTIREEGT
ncbi:MAG: ceramide glucosyltransferase, partial [Acidobacteria bacterium]|nr:ceramide glucosyltransferase [Acidobacteriota bacterium]